MPKAMFLVGWDDKIGSIVEAKYPPNSEVSTDQLLQFLVTIQSVGASQTVQIQDDSQSVLIFGAFPSQIGISRAFNYDFIIAFLEESETPDLGKIRARLKLEGEKIIQAPKPDKQQLFLKFARSFFNPPANKIVFVGFPNSGKTSTKMFFFEKVREEDLLNTSLEPTLGFETQKYDFLDLNICLFDASGQEMERWLDEKEGVLSAAELVIFFFSVQDWTENAIGVQDYLTRLNTVIKESESRTKIAIFCHKSDQLSANAEEFKREIQTFTQTLDVPVFFTSIINGGNQDLILGMQLILENFSGFFSTFYDNIMPILHQFDLQPIFIIDKYQKIAVNFASEAGVAEKFEALKNFYFHLVKNYENSLQESPSLFASWLVTWNIGLVFADFTFLHPDLAHLLIKANSLKGITGFFEVYQNLLADYNWRTLDLNKL